MLLLRSRGGTALDVRHRPGERPGTSRAYQPADRPDSGFLFLAVSAVCGSRPDPASRVRPGCAGFWVEPVLRRYRLSGLKPIWRPLARRRGILSRAEVTGRDARRGGRLSVGPQEPLDALRSMAVAERASDVGRLGLVDVRLGRGFGHGLRLDVGHFRLGCGVRLGFADRVRLSPFQFGLGLAGGFPVLGGFG
jgi:hypothetical protein